MAVLNKLTAVEPDDTSAMEKQMRLRKQLEQLTTTEVASDAMKIIMRIGDDVQMIQDVYVSAFNAEVKEELHRVCVTELGRLFGVSSDALKQQDEETVLNHRDAVLALTATISLLGHAKDAASLIMEAVSSPLTLKVQAATVLLQLNPDMSPMFEKFTPATSTTKERLFLLNFQEQFGLQVSHA